MNMNGLGVSGEPLDLIPFLALLAHPLLASALVIWVWRQYAWRKKSHELKGEERSVHLAQHERNGERLLWATGGVILVAFLGRAISGWYNEGDVLSNLFPQSLHGFMGPVGFGLMVYLTRLGREAKSNREAGESFAVPKLKHGRAADLIVYLVFIHAFLGFIYTFEVLSA